MNWTTLIYIAQILGLLLALFAVPASATTPFLAAFGFIAGVGLMAVGEFINNHLAKGKQR